MIATPPGHGDANFVAKGGGSCAWHSYTGATAYINLPYQLDAGVNCNNTGSTFAPVSIVAYHELTETNTDPLTNAWYATDLSHEDADKCAWGNGGQPAPEPRTFGSNQYWVQSNWSNRDGQCEFFLLPPTTSGVSSSGSSTLTGTSTASCNFTRSGGYFNTGSDANMTGALSAGSKVPPTSSWFQCDFTTSDPSAGSNFGVSQYTSGGLNQTSLSFDYGGGVPYGAKGTNQICVFGAVTYPGVTVNLPYTCTTF